MFNCRSFSAIKVKVGATNRSGGDSKNYAVAILQNWIGDCFDFNAMRAVVRSALMQYSPLQLLGDKWERGKGEGKFRDIETAVTGGQLLIYRRSGGLNIF